MFVASEKDFCLETPSHVEVCRFYSGDLFSSPLQTGLIYTLVKKKKKVRNPFKKTKKTTKKDNCQQGCVHVRVCVCMHMRVCV